MKIRENGKEIFNNQSSIIELVVEEKDTVQITTPAADTRTCVYVMSYDNCKLSIEGGASIIEEIPTPGEGSFEIHKDTGVFILNNETLDSTGMYNLSIPLVSRIIRQLLDNSKIKYQYVKSENIEVFRVDKTNHKFFYELVKDCIEYRCSQSADIGSCEIIRQLPIRVAIDESDKLIALNKKHAIYSSSRGGYNIKVKDYKNGKLEHYQYFDSKMWD